MKTKVSGVNFACAAGLLLAAAFGPHLAFATEPIFTYTYLTETTPKGAFEVEQWVTYRNQKSQGTYDLWQLRTELEYGISDRWSVSLYANAYQVTAQADNSFKSQSNYTAVGDGDEVSGGGPVTFGSHVPNADELPLPSARYSKSGFEGVSVESIYQFMSPYKDGFGLAGYIEYTYGSNEQELEFKLLWQKNFLGDDLVVAANLVVEFERESWSQVTTEKEAKASLTGGISYRFAPGWRIALEGRNVRGYEGGYSFSSGQRDYSVWYAGPTISYGDKNFFVVGGYATQLPWATAYSQAAKLEQLSGRNYKDAERNNFRVIAGISF
jgi:hypothetical protein